MAKRAKKVIQQMLCECGAIDKLDNKTSQFSLCECNEGTFKDGVRSIKSGKHDYIIGTLTAEGAKTMDEVHLSR